MYTDLYHNHSNIIKQNLYDLTSGNSSKHNTPCEPDTSTASSESSIKTLDNCQSFLENKTKQVNFGGNTSLVPFKINRLYVLLLGLYGERHITTSQGNNIICK